MTRILLASLVTAAAALLCAPIHAASIHRYEVRVDASFERLAVRACFDGNAPQALVAESDGARFYLESMRIGERQIEPAGDRVVLDATGENTCVDYQVKLQPSQTSAQAGGPETRRVGRNMLTSIGDWLWRPHEPGKDIELTFLLPSGVEVSAPWQRKAGSEGRTVFLAGATPSNWSGIVAFGYFTPRDIEVPGAVLHVAVLNAPEARQVQLEKWIENTARNVALLYGRFPVASLQVVAAPTTRGRGPVPWAYVARGGGPAVHLFVNMTRPAEEFERDWSLTHEMSHLFLPYVVARDAWLYEGVPTYLQNVLMARGGALSVEQAWQRMRSGFQSGERNAPELNLARANDRVANGAYLRVYWAGAAMMLDADLRLRERTGGKQSLGSALEQLSSCCAAQARRWSAREIIARLDELTGSTIFGDLVRAQFESNGYPDYDAVLMRAGIKVEGMEVEFDAAAPWAAIRDAVMRAGH